MLHPLRSKHESPFGTIFIALSKIIYLTSKFRLSMYTDVKKQVFYIHVLYLECYVNRGNNPTKVLLSTSYNQTLKLQ